MTAIASPLQAAVAGGSEETTPPPEAGTGARRPHTVRPVALVARAMPHPETVLDRVEAWPAVAVVEAVQSPRAVRSPPAVKVAKAVGQVVMETGVAAMAAARHSRREV